MMDIVNEIKNLKGSILILTHHNADIDAMSSAIGLHLGLKQLKLESRIGVAESIGRPAKNISEGFDVLINPDCGVYDTVILVETSVPEQLKGVKNLRADMIIDHHPAGKLTEKAKAFWIEPLSKSTSQMIFKILKELGCKIDKKIAEILGAGIVADTAHLRLADLEVFEILVELLETGVKFEEILNLITTRPDISENIACLKAAKRIKIYRIDDILVVFSMLGSHEAAAARGFVRLGADIAVVAAIKEDEIRISSRGKEKILNYGLDLSEIFKEVGAMIDGSGGGHDLAGSANGKNKKAIDNVFEFIIKEVSKKAGKEAVELK